jgi:branched-chain amino acid transport system substrate-binding protein
MRYNPRFIPLTLLAALALALSAIAAGCGGDDDDDEAAAPPPVATEPGEEPTDDGDAAPCDGTIGVIFPITGDAASIGAEQLSWSQFAISRYNQENGTTYQLEEGDSQLDPAQASTIAQRYADNDSILAVVGPAGSQEVEAAGPVLTRANLAIIAPSATRASLTKSGDFPTFFRVIPNDDDQGPTIASFIEEELEADEVFIIDDQTSYSTGLADTAAEALEGAGITVRRDSVSQDQTDFSALVGRVGQAGVVFLPWQLAARAQVFGQQLAEQGSEAVIFGSDGLFAEDFSIEGAYVASFAPDIRGIEGQEDLVQGYEAEFGDFTSTFGPPAYAATWVAADAITRACDNGEVSREDVVEAVGETDWSDSILGQDIRFNDEGDVEDARFFIFQVQGPGEYELID